MPSSSVSRVRENLTEGLKTAIRNRTRIQNAVRRRLPIRRRVTTVDTVFGRLRCFEEDVLTAQIREFGAHTRPELAMLLSFIEPGDQVFDLGAHVGSFTIPIAHKVGPNGNVVAVEATDDYFALLVENIQLNAVARTVTPVNAIVAPAGSYAALHALGNSMATRFVRRPRWYPRRRHSMSIDDIAATHGSPDVVKIDIEGLELDVLESSQMLRQHRPILYTEVSSVNMGRYGRTVAELDGMLRGLRYRLFYNVGSRNASRDTFEIDEVATLADVPDPGFGHGRVYDALAVPADSSRLPH